MTKNNPFKKRFYSAVNTPRTVSEARALVNKIESDIWNIWQQKFSTEWVETEEYNDICEMCDKLCRYNLLLAFFDDNYIIMLQ